MKIQFVLLELMMHAIWQRSLRSLASRHGSSLASNQVTNLCCRLSFNDGPAQAKPLAQIFAISGFRSEFGARLVQPAEGFFAERVNVGNLFQIKDAIGSGANSIRYTNEFFDPLAGQLALEDENRAGRIAIWQRNS
jgi:hypothetical protein